jgi:hypothetical protein
MKNSISNLLINIIISALVLLATVGVFTPDASEKNIRIVYQAAFCLWLVKLFVLLFADALAEGINRGRAGEQYNGSD